MAHLWILLPGLVALFGGAEFTIWVTGNAISPGAARAGPSRLVLYALIVLTCVIAMLLPLDSEIGLLVAALFLIPLVGILLQLAARRASPK